MQVIQTHRVSKKNRENECVSQAFALVDMQTNEDKIKIGREGKKNKDMYLNQ